MKKLFFLSIVFGLVSAFQAFGQDASAATAPAATTTPAASTTSTAAGTATATTSTTTAAPALESYTYESDHYAVRSYVSNESAQAFASRLEAYLTVYNQYFHFDLDRVQVKLKVRMFADKARYDQYLQKVIGETRDDFVYLHYSDANRSELVGYDSVAKPVAESSITHQAFIQFLRAFVSQPPLWIREGFAVYFENVTYDAAAGTASIKDNLAWLETLKSLLLGDRSSEAISLDQLLAIGVDDAKSKIQVFYPEAWGLVQYLTDSSVKSHNRILWDAIAGLSKTASLEDNTQAVIKLAFKWDGIDAVNQSILDYYKSKLTYKELVQGGIDAYSASDPKTAEADFKNAIALSQASFVPYYYLGLINYDAANYTEAETYYKTALEKGADPALTNYALGVNAFADNRFDSATEYLDTTLKLDANFKDRVTDLLDRMES